MFLVAGSKTLLCCAFLEHQFSKGDFVENQSKQRKYRLQHERVCMCNNYELTLEYYAKS